MWTAARALGAVASPIVLYYCLAQAGQAILAARAVANDWHARPSHGLSRTSFPSGHDKPSLGGVLVADNGRGMFQQITRLLACPSLPGATSLDALIGSLPGAGRFIGESTARLPLWIESSCENHDLALGQVRLYVSPFPDELVPVTNIPYAGDPVNLPTRAQLGEWLKPYPTLTSVGLPKPWEIVKHGGQRVAPGNLIILVWEVGQPHMDLAAWNVGVRELISYPEGGQWEREPRGYAVPVVGTNAAPLHPLATWWAILYTMSMLARYSPDLWTRLLNPDRSREAERIRHVLDTALDLVPYLVVREIAQ